MKKLEVAEVQQASSNRKHTIELPKQFRWKRYASGTFGAEGDLIPSSKALEDGPAAGAVESWASVEGEESARRLEGFLAALCEYGDKFDGVLYSKRRAR